MGYGIDAFARNQQGWSFVAVRAPAERVAEVLAGRAGVLRHEANVTPQPMSDEAGIQGERERRHAFLIQPRDSEWATLLLTVHWFENECFISTNGAKSADEAQLLVGDPAEVERADHFLLAVPEAVRSDAPHVLEKLGIIADAVAGGEEADFPEDESEFRAQMVEGIWKRAEAVRRASKRD